MTAITPGLVFTLGLSQLVCWGISYYLVGVFSHEMAEDLGWSLTGVQSGYALALVVMGLSSGAIGRAVDRHGGRRVMSAGSLLLAAGCGLLAVTGPGPLYWVAWAILGLAMRCTLYDAAFAALARIAGPHARRPISQITLLGGLASTVFWPLGHALAEWLGWRGAVAIYALTGLATLGLHLRIPHARWQPAPATASAAGSASVSASRPASASASDSASASASASSTSTRPPTSPSAARASRPTLDANAWLFAMICSLVGFTNAAMSAQMILLLVGLGLGNATAVWVSSLRGIAQTTARLAEIVFGRRWSPLDLNLAAALICLAGFAIGPIAGHSPAAGAVFAFLFGAGNGLLTITRGTVPLQLFAPEQYGAIVGRLIAPGFYLAATAPVVVAALIEGPGAAAAAWLLLALSAILSLTAWWLRRRVRAAVRKSRACPPR